MDKLSLRERILMELENLISRSCKNGEVTKQSQQLHEMLLKKHYNAVGVQIDYHRRRVEMDLVMDDTAYDPKKVNTVMPTIHANFFFKNLKDFLWSGVHSDSKSLAFYAGLLQKMNKKDTSLQLA